MAFLFPKLFPGCIQEGGYNVSLSLENAMAMYWKPIAFQINASCYDPYEGTFSVNTTLTTTDTLHEIMCGAQLFFGSPPGTPQCLISFNGSAFKNEELYIPDFYLELELGSTQQAGGRYGSTITSLDIPSSGNISFNGQSFGMAFFSDDHPGELFSGSGSLSIISERTFD